ncbi:MAG: ATP-binding protein [Chloroflexota bacterium]|nr:ATP-binding protein [Chloroflexota bacterium]
MTGGRADGTLERRFQALLKPDLLVLDDFGLKPLVPPAPEDLYDVINERYERGGIPHNYQQPASGRMARPVR